MMEKIKHQKNFPFLTKKIVLSATVISLLSEECRFHGCGLCSLSKQALCVTKLKTWVKIRYFFLAQHTQE
jgi:hypothetical protein